MEFPSLYSISFLISFLLDITQTYFPTISQPEGLPLKIQDAMGKDWIFQFRFWPNNNSRMYVLEGVTPCIQSMQLRAGDTGILLSGIFAFTQFLFTKQESTIIKVHGSGGHDQLIH